MMGVVALNIPGPWPLMDPIPPDEIRSGTPEQRGFIVHREPDAGLTVGLWSCTPWVAARGPYPYDEFFTILEGSVTLRMTDGRAETFGKGDSVFIPKGLDCIWDQREAISKTFVIRENGPDDPDATGPVKLDPGARLHPSPGPAHDLLIGAAPQQIAAQACEDPSGQISVGVWATTPYTRRPIPYPRHEVMLVLEGKVTLTAMGEAPQTFGAGDSVFVPKGCVVDWVSTVYVRKIYCSVTPKAAT